MSKISLVNLCLYFIVFITQGEKIRDLHEKYFFKNKFRIDEFFKKIIIFFMKILVKIFITDNAKIDKIIILIEEKKLMKNIKSDKKAVYIHGP